MKKLIVLALVLSMATMANAGLVLSTTSTGPLNVGDTTTLSVGTDAEISPGVGEGYWAIGSLTVNGMTTGGVSLYPTEGGIAIFDDAVTSGVVLPEGENGVWGMIALGTLASVPIGGIYDEITFTCNGPVDTVVTLYFSETTEVWTAVSSVTISQVPEPITMALLGLGGLFLRRRK